MTRRVRRYAAFTAMTGLLFAQSCLVAHACLLSLAPPAMAAPAAVAHADCAGVHGAPKSDALCELNCQSVLSVPATPAPVTAPPLATPVLVVAALDSPAVVAIVADRRAPRTPMATAPPVAIRYCRFLI
ncbi:MAG: hypothetical protein U1F15_06905 [Burkholderiales bacterium]